MTLFGENGFVFGPEALASEATLAKAVAHEVYRLSTSVRLTQPGIGGAAARAEADAAAAIADDVAMLLGLDG